MKRNEQLLVRAAFIAAILSPFAQGWALPPGSQPPPASCGLLCAPKATISIAVPAAPANGRIEGVSFPVNYKVTNQYHLSLTGTVLVTFNNKATEGTPVQIALAPQQSTSGTVLVLNPSSGPGVINAEFDSPLVCTAPKTANMHPICKGLVPYATTFGGVPIAPDKDGDGLSDDIESSLLATYTPLLLFSRDHGSQEKYAPIDVLDFVRASKLVSKEKDIPSLNKSALQNTSVILDPTQDGKDDGTIDDGQIVAGAKATQTTLAPRPIYVSPPDSTKHGADWQTVMARRNVGLYGHVAPLTIAQIPDPALLVSLASKYCGGDITCNRVIYKVEYWQFFGYSHDFEVPKGIETAEPLLDALLPIPGIVPVAPVAADILDHGGDWCTVQLYIDPAEAVADKAILAVYHYAHGLQFRFDLSQSGIASGPIPLNNPNNPTAFQMKQFQGMNAGKPVALPFQKGAQTQAYQNAQNNILRIARSDTTSPYVHPVVYAEWGGHEFWPTPGWTFQYVSKHGGDGYAYFAAPPPNVGEVGAPMPGVPSALDVVGYAGFWGFYGWENHNKPPQGPPLHRQWFWTPGGKVVQSVRGDSPPF